MQKQLVIRNSIFFFPPSKECGFLHISNSCVLVAAQVCLLLSVENLKVNITCCSPISHLCSCTWYMRLQALVLSAVEPFLLAEVTSCVSPSSLHY